MTNALTLTLPLKLTGSVSVGALGAAAPTLFFRKAVLHPQKSIKTREYSGISPQIDGI